MLRPRLGSTLVACQVASHSAVDWAFIGGSPISDVIVQWPASRGTSEQGKNPGSREGGIFFSDDQNNLWLGLGISWMFLGSNKWMPLNDIWYYNLATSRWFWKTGLPFASDAGTYPTQIIEGSSDRGFLTAEAKIKPTQWYDRQRNLLFIFGGWSATALNNQVLLSSRVEGNSMWRYDYKNNESVPLGPAVNRTSYQGSATWPAGRYGGAGWLDNNGTMWLYGGIGYGNDDTLEDMWVFDESSTKWLPITYSGSSHPIVANAATWYDSSTHTMYLFGGEDHLQNYNRDLWTFNPTTLVWTKISGDAASQGGSYGTRGVFSSSNHPGVRASAGCVFESSGFLWLFGGRGMGYQLFVGTLNDLWVYSIALNQWAWMGGSQDIYMDPEYPDLMTYSVDNTLAGREGVAMYISGRNMYIYGGRISDTHHKADLWHGRIFRDECALNATNCGPLATCSDLDDGYACLCPPGYSGDGRGANGCIELDECATSLHNCSSHAQCINTVGGFECQCNSGFEGPGYGVNGCADIDECALGFNCTEPAFCVNTEGGFRCDCPQGQVPDGSNGCTAAPVNPPGVIVAPDGTMTTPDGKVITPDGRVVDTVGIAVGVSIGGAVAIAGAVVLVLFLRRKKKRGVTITTAMKSLSNFDDRFNIPYSELEFSRELGAGSFGKVFLGSWRKAEVALKLATLATWEDFANEVKLTINLPPHPNVVQVFGISRDGPHPVLILEYCDGGSLDSLLYDTSYSLSLAQQLEIIHGVAKGMLHLHKSNIIHRDLAARNVLLSGGRPKISDFGLARSVDKQSQSGKTKSDVGPLRWMAPESLRDATYNPLSDVWSFGVVIFEILCREEPHIREDQMTVGIRIRDDGLTPTIPNHCDPFMRDLMRACWKLDPTLRPKFEEICSRIEERIEMEKGTGESGNGNSQ